MKKIAIVGAGGNAREIAGLIRDLGGYTFLGFIADRQGEHDSALLGGFDWPAEHELDCLAMGIGNPCAKLEVGRRLRRLYPKISWPSLVHPSAYVGPTCELSEGAIVCVGALATENVRVGSFSQLNFGCTVGHETRIGEGCLINPGANISGGVVLGDAVMIGTGAQILQYLTVGDGATVGAGAVVLKDVPPGRVVAGVPARELQPKP
jgi:sugar O-acyltransferase (sialic acid O-acetyltransferase NeuD family)